MKKRLVLFLVLALALTALAPYAMADHCRKCNFNGTRCAIATTGGKPFCDDSTGVCVLTGTTCTGPHPLVEPEPLAAEFTVVSVERLDEPQAPASGTRVASLETTKTIHR